MPLVVAEIGQNHNGDVYTALRMIGMAERCGADAVKFQLRNCEAEFPPEVLDAPHPQPEHAFGATYREHRRALDLTADDIRHLVDRIRYNEWNVGWICTPCWVGAVEELERLNCPTYKVASKDLANMELLKAIAATGKPVILSTGMHGFDEIAAALEIVPHATVLHCRSLYPCPPEKANLRRMVEIRDVFGVPVGYSDHTPGTAVCAAAVALGATVIEKHVTLSRRMKGRDHSCSAEEDDLRRIVGEAREVEAAVW